MSFYTLDLVYAQILSHVNRSMTEQSQAELTY